MLYNPSSPLTQSVGHTITGRNLAHGRRSFVERAFVGGDLNRNSVRVTDLTIVQCAMLVGCCRQYVRAALAIADDEAARAAVLAGERTLLDAAKPTASETLAHHLARSTLDELSEAARVVSPEFIWDTMVSPLMGEKEKFIAS